MKWGSSMEFLNVGKYVNTHGIKGEIRLLSKFRHKDKVFKKDFKVYIGKDKKEYTINTYRVHKSFDMLTFDGINDINLIEPLKGSFVFINKEDLILDKNTFLSVDLIDFDVIIEGKIIGKITEIIDTPANEVLVLESRVMIPYVKDFIKNIDKESKIVEVNDVKGLL